MRPLGAGREPGAYFQKKVKTKKNTNMKTYTHDYTLAANAAHCAWMAQRQIAAGQTHDAARTIDTLRDLLDAYLAQDNISEDNDTASGYVKVADLPELRYAVAMTDWRDRTLYINDLSDFPNGCDRPRYMTLHDAVELLRALDRHVYTALADDELLDDYKQDRMGFYLEPEIY